MAHTSDSTLVLVNGTKNAEHFHNKARFELAELEAAGFDFEYARKNLGIKKENWHSGAYKKVATPRFNGGIKAMMISRLQKGDKLYRFGAQTFSRECIATGRWWFDEDVCIYLWKISGNDDHKFRSSARSCFAVPEEWSDMSRIVTGTLAHDYWCFKGVSATARSSSKSTSMHGGGMISLQIYIPGGLDQESFENDLKDGALLRSVY